MRKIPQNLKQSLSNNPYYKKCARENNDCAGRITWEHAFLYSNRQINESWSIIPLCWYHHLGEGLDKQLNQFIALHRATKEDLRKYPNFNWSQRLSYLKNYVLHHYSGDVHSEFHV